MLGSSLYVHMFQLHWPFKRRPWCWRGPLGKWVWHPAQQQQTIITLLRCSDCTVSWFEPVGFYNSHDAFGHFYRGVSDLGKLFKNFAITKMKKFLLSVEFHSSAWWDVLVWEQPGRKKGNPTVKWCDRIGYCLFMRCVHVHVIQIRDTSIIDIIQCQKVKSPEPPELRAHRAPAAGLSLSLSLLF